MLSLRATLSRAGASYARTSAACIAPSSSHAQARMSSEATHMLGWMRTTPQKIDLAANPFETLALTVQDNNVVHLKLNRPKTVNAMNMQMWVELGQAFEQIEQDQSIKAVIVSGEGRGFTSGMDLNVFATMQKLASKVSCEGRKREALMRIIDEFQKVISAPEKCRVPVIAAVHGPCIGAGVDFITACDLRYADTSAVFSVKEVDLAIIADVGTLQRLPKLVGEQQAKELAFTGRNFSGLEAERSGLVLKTLKDTEELMAHAQQVAASIAEKSPLTVRGIKQTIHYQRDHSTTDSLQQIRYHNAAVLYSDDLVQAIGAHMSKTKPTFRDD
uniref:Enoyl-CoA hydratase n=1 Tax=Globisporangium ultimum (strain ATCC 200006 / CBS 805.95 / DAOM BR144) TaxID=431595 RepID=K3WG46_GLOUD